MARRISATTISEPDVRRGTESWPSRREFLRCVGLGGLTFATGACAPMIWRRPRAAGAGSPSQLHLQFGADAAREMVASWVTPVAVARPRLRLGTVRDGFGQTIPAGTRTHIEGRSGTGGLTHNAS